MVPSLVMVIMESSSMENISSRSGNDLVYHLLYTYILTYMHNNGKIGAHSHSLSLILVNSFLTYWIKGIMLFDLSNCSWYVVLYFQCCLLYEYLDCHPSPMLVGLLHFCRRGGDSLRFWSLQLTAYNLLFLIVSEMYGLETHFSGFVGVWICSWGVKVEYIQLKICNFSLFLVNSAYKNLYYFILNTLI